MYGIACVVAQCLSQANLHKRLKTPLNLIPHRGPDDEGLKHQVRKQVKESPVGTLFNRDAIDAIVEKHGNFRVDAGK